jgi:sulfatase modifying factor 1
MSLCAPRGRAPIAVLAILGAGLGVHLLALPAATARDNPDRVRIPAGEVRPLYRRAKAEPSPPTRVDAFRLDRLPVTNADFLTFVKARPEWQRGAAKGLFVDPDYLAHWAGPTTLGPAAAPDAPVVRVSWFAARAYCAARGGRLPTEAEWERAAAAGQEGPDGRDEPGWRETILGWYAKPTPARLPPAGRRPANFYGVHDLHGLVWEWVEDFGATLVTADAREAGDTASLRFCAGGAADATDPEDYAGFMRSAMRSALKARHTTASLGFRCAADLEEQIP